MTLRRLLFGEKDVFGLDIGSSCVKAVLLAKDDDEDGYKVMAAERIEVTHEGTDERSRTKSFINAIRNCIRSARIKTKYSVCGVCGPDVAIRPFEFSELYDDDIGDMVLFEAEQVCPFERGHYIVDYQLFGNQGDDVQQSDSSAQRDGAQGLLVAATPEVIGRKIQLTKAALLNCVLMDVDGLALSNCFKGSEKCRPDETIAILDVGSSITNLVVLDGNGLPFVRDIPYAANEIINHIAAQRGISPLTVKKILYKTQDEDKVISEIGENLQRACKTLIGNITETLRYCTVQRGQAVNRIFVCGGFAVAKGFIKSLNSQLPPQVVLWNPFDKIRCDSAIDNIDVIEKYGPSLALAAGLAMRTI